MRSRNPGGLDRLCVSRVAILHTVASALLTAIGRTSPSREPHRTELSVVVWPKRQRRQSRDNLTS